jgi:hypothetical protein
MTPLIPDFPDGSAYVGATSDHIDGAPVLMRHFETPAGGCLTYVLEGETRVCGYQCDMFGTYSLNALLATGEAKRRYRAILRERRLVRAA